MRRRRRKSRQMKLIVIGSICLLSVMTVGYAAFGTSLNISAKGNIVESQTTSETIKKEYCNASSGDGLYKDTTEEGRCVYRGNNPDNYITFNEEDAGWRIISIETDGTMKIMKRESVTQMAYDGPGKRNASYCTHSQNGCNVWGSSTTMLNSTGENITSAAYQINGSTYQLPSEEASINVYLNQTYYNNLSDKAKEQLKIHDFNVGPVNRVSGQTLETDIAQEKVYKWKGNIGLINVSDYVKASTNKECANTYSYFGSSACYNNPGAHNYLYKSTTMWTISPCAHSNSFHVWDVFASGKLDANYAYDNRGVHPTIYLKSDIVLSGTGTENDPYIIK